MNADRCGPIIVGGPSRCGKSHLVGQIGRACPRYFAAPFELLLNVYMWDWAAMSKGARCLALKDYVQHTRSTNADGSERAAPVTFLSPDWQPDLISAAANSSCVTSGIAGVLDAIACRSEAQSWIGADYHAEGDFRALRRTIEDLRLIVVFRDPVEAICASLYWRTFPDQTVDTQRQISFRIESWRMAAIVALALKRDFPSDVMIVDSNRLWNGARGEAARLAAWLGCPDDALLRAKGHRPWFSRDSREFLCPDGSYRALLEADEIAEIENRTRNERQSLADAGAAGTSSLPAGNYLVARFPRSARFMLTLRYFPGQRFLRTVSRTRRAAWLLLANMTARRARNAGVGRS